MLFGDILRLSAARHPDKTALICGARALSYAAFDRAANAYANAVLGRGLAKGECVAVMSPNSLEYAIIHFGNARTGTILANLSPLLGEAEIVHILEQTGARLMLVDAAAAERIAALRERLPSVELFVTIGASEALDGPDFEAFLAGASDRPPEVALAETDPFAMTFTGGTTGFPKGALVSHRARVASSYITALEHTVSGADVAAILTPMFHAIGGTIWFPSVVLCGTTCVIVPQWEAPAFVDLAGRHGVSAAMMVPVQLRDMLADGAYDAAKLKSLRMIGVAGAATPVEVIKTFEERLPHATFTDHYGQSETGALALFKPWHPREKAGSIGLPAVGVELRLLAPDGAPVEDGEVGEIVVRGAFMMEGYFRNPEETASYFRGGDGWGWTGDLARRDQDGFLTIVGRSKEMIISGGLNIYPREVEVALERHEAVAECAVFGVPDERWGESPVAYVVLHRGARPSERQLIEFCGNQLSRWKRPKVLRVVEAIPKTAAGKVQKMLLREAFLTERR